MNNDELKRATKHLGGLFSGQVTQELALLIKDDFRPFEFKLALETISNHKRSRADGFVNYRDLLTEMKAAHRPAAAPVANLSDKEGEWADVYRRQHPHLVGRSDAEAILRVCRGIWMKSPRDDDARAAVGRECRVKLQSAGMTADLAVQWAATIFEEPDHFRTVLEQLRGDLPVFDRSEREPAGAVS